MFWKSAVSAVISSVSIELGVKQLADNVSAFRFVTSKLHTRPHSAPKVMTSAASILTLQIFPL